MGKDETREAQLVTSGPLFEAWKGPQGSIRLDWTKKGAVRLIVRDYGHVAYVPAILRCWNDTLRATPRLVVLLDFWDMTSYDAGFYGQIQAWGVAHRKDLEAVLVLARSKLVRMGASLGNVALGGMIRLLTEREELDRECLKLSLPGSGPSTGSP